MLRTELNDKIDLIFFFSPPSEYLPVKEKIISCFDQFRKHHRFKKATCLRRIPHEIFFCVALQPSAQPTIDKIKFWHFNDAFAQIGLKRFNALANAISL